MKSIRECAQCKRTMKITGRGRCAMCYKQMMKAGLPNDHIPLNPNSGNFSSRRKVWNAGRTDVYSPEVIENLSVMNSGEKSHLFKHGNHIAWHRKARKVVQKSLGQKLIKGQIVHHIDGNPQNNVPENLMVFNTHSEHMKYHWAIQKSKAVNGRMVKHK